MSDGDDPKQAPYVSRRTYTYQKPCPDESIYKHLLMLYNYCKEQGLSDVAPERREAFLETAKRLAKLGEGKCVRKLQDFGE